MINIGTKSVTKWTMVHMYKYYNTEENVLKNVCLVVG